MVVTDILYKKFDYITSKLLGQQGEKSIIAVQSFLSSIKVKF